MTQALLYDTAPKFSKMKMFVSTKTEDQLVKRLKAFTLMTLGKSQVSSICSCSFAQMKNSY